VARWPRFGRAGARSGTSVGALLVEAGVVRPNRLTPLQTETDELIAIFVSIVKKVKARKRR
jgi:hypothetical protein